MRRSREYTGEEIGKLLQIPDTSTELLKYIEKCDGRISFLRQVEEFLIKYASFKETYLNNLLNRL
jgi:hypothetical protein